MEVIWIIRGQVFGSLVRRFQPLSALVVVDKLNGLINGQSINRLISGLVIREIKHWNVERGSRSSDEKIPVIIFRIQRIT